MIEKIRTVSPDPILERSPINEATVAKIAHVNHVIDEVNKAIGGEKPKVYKALLSQSGTDAPTAVILENSLGDIVWTYADVGHYIGTLANAFTEQKTYLSLHNGGLISGVVRQLDGTIKLITAANNFTPVNNRLSNTSILIEVYP